MLRSIKSSKEIVPLIYQASAITCPVFNESKGSFSKVTKRLNYM